MANFQYAPEGLEPQSWVWDPDKMMNDEAEAIERVTQMTFGEWKTAVERESMLATRALLWIFLRRDRPTLKFNEVAFSMSEVEFVWTDEEWTAIRDAIDLLLRTGRSVDDSQLGLYNAAIEKVGPPPVWDDNADGEQVDTGSVTGGDELPPLARHLAGEPEQDSSEEAGPKAD